MEIRGTELADNIFATSGNDTIFGDLGNDRLFGDEGEDLIFGEGGDDSVSGEEGNDTLFGDEDPDSDSDDEDSGDDTLVGGDGSDSLNGGGGNDFLFAGGNEDGILDLDTLIGGDGNDTLEAGTFLDGGNGNDSLRGNTLDDQLFGGDGNDTLIGQSGDDTLYGGSGNDRIETTSGDDTAFGEEGNDVVLGAQGNQILYGDRPDAVVEGDAQDTINGGGNNDTLIGGVDNDSLDGGSGDDRLIGVGNTASSNRNYGRDTIDILKGGFNQDTFVLGQRIEGENVVFYDSGSNGLGTEDYALITDFELGGDTLELIGSPNDYSFAASPADLPSGVGVYLEQESGQELIAILEDVSVSDIEQIQTTFDPGIEFTDVLQTPTLISENENQGELEVTITNEADLTNTTLKLYASTDRVLDNRIFPTDEAFESADLEAQRNALNTLSDTIEGTEIDALQGTDELLGTINIDLIAGAKNNFTLDFTSDDFRNPSVVSPGGYYLIAEVDFGDGNNNNSNNLATQFISSNDTDVILDWNSTFLNAVQAEGKAEIGLTLGQDDTTLENIPGVAPPVVARNAAIMHIAMFDAVNALSDNPLSSYLGEGLPSVPEGASQQLAAVGAAYTVLTELFPEQRNAFNTQLDRSRDETRDDAAAENAGFNFGVEVAQAVLQDRSDDGTEQAQVPYEMNARGIYQEYVEERRSADNRVTALLPEWDNVNTFAIDSIEDFRPENLTEEKVIQGFIPFSDPENPTLVNPKYAEQVNEVKQVGELTSEVRTDDETEIAEFWSYDRPDTFRPPGQWNEIAQEAVLNEADINSLEENALLFAQLNIAMADAGIVTWDVKYTPEQELLRPVTSIREINPNEDPSDLINNDPTWEPLIGTPAFPDYISGHSAFGGAAATVLEDFFGENVELEIPSQELPGVTRTFGSFMDAALENANSRLYGGVHIDASNQDGVAVGMAVAENILNEGNIFA